MFLRTNLRIISYTVISGALYLFTSGVIGGYQHFESNLVFYVFVGFLGFLVGTVLSNIFRRMILRYRVPSALVFSAIVFIFAIEIKEHLAAQSQVLQSLFDVPYGEWVLVFACVTALLFTHIKPTSTAKCIDADKY